MIARKTFATVLVSALPCLFGAQPAGAGPVWKSHGPDGGAIAALAIDPQAPRTVYAGTLGAGLFKSTNGGELWKAVTGFSQRFVSTLAIDPQTPTTLYAGTGRCEAGTEGGVFKSTDGGQSWSAVLTLLHVCPLALDPNAPPTLYAGTGGAGVFKSTHRGASWGRFRHAHLIPNSPVPSIPHTSTT